MFSLASCAEPPPFQTASMSAETLAFFAVSDWGGQALPPYTTPLELENAEAMGAFARPALGVILTRLAHLTQATSPPPSIPSLCCPPAATSCRGGCRVRCLL